MFREVRNEKNRISREDCLALLKAQPRGVLSLLGDEGYPYGVPLSHWYNEEDGCLYFHGGKQGHRVDALRSCSKASYCVMDTGTPVEGEWYLLFRSVIVFGHIVPVEDPEQALDHVRRLSRQFTSDEAFIEREIRQSGANVLVFKLVPEHMTGKQIAEC